MRAADDEPEEAARGHRREPRLAGVGEQVDDLGRVGRAVGQVGPSRATTSSIEAEAGTRRVSSEASHVERMRRGRRSERGGGRPSACVTSGASGPVGSRVRHRATYPVLRAGRGQEQVLERDAWRPRPTPTPPASTPTCDRTCPGAPAGEAPGPRLPLHLLLPAPRPAAPLAPRVRRAAGRRAGVRRPPGLRVRRRHRCVRRRAGHAAARAGQPAASHRVAAGAHGLLRAARVGDGLPAVPGRGAPQRLAAAARVVGHRHRGRVAPHPVLPLRRLPLLHRAGTTAQRAAARARRPGGVRAAGVPARRHGPLQARLPAHADDQLGPGRRLLRAGPRHPRAGHAGRAVRPRGPRLRAGAHRDAGGQGGVRQGAAGVRRAGRPAAAAARRGVRAAARRGRDGPAREPRGQNS